MGSEREQENRAAEDVRRVGIAYRSTNPREDFVLLTTEELLAVNQLAKEKYPDQEHPFDNLTKLEIQRLVEEMKREISPLPIDEEELKARKQRAEAIARDLDQVPAGGKVLIFAGEGSVLVYGHPRVHQAFEEAHRRQVTIKVCVGPVLSVEKENGSIKSKGLLYFAEQGWIELWQRPTRETVDHFRLFTTYGIAVEQAHEAATKFKERKQKQFINEVEKQNEIKRKAKRFFSYIQVEEGGTMTRQTGELLLIALGLVLTAIGAARGPVLDRTLNILLAGGATFTGLILLLLRLVIFPRMIPKK